MAISTESIRKYVEALYALMPRSSLWGRLFRTPQLLFKRVATQDPDLESPYTQTPDDDVPNDMSGTVFSRFLSIFAIRASIVDEQIYDVANEAHPATASKMLTEWEQFYDLPVKTGYTDAERQERLKYYTDNWRAPRSLAYLKDYAIKLGGDITITSTPYHAWRGYFGMGVFGAARCGDRNTAEVVTITVNSLTNVTPDYFVARMEEQIYAGVLVNWLVNVQGNLIMRYSEADPNLIMRFITSDDNIYIPMG